MKKPKKKNALVTTTSSKLDRVDYDTLTPDKNPVMRYIASLDSPESRRTMGSALDRAIPTPGVEGRPGLAAARLPWHQMKPVQLAAMRLRLIGQYAPATANRMIYAIRGVLRAAVGIRVGRARLLSRDALADALDALKPAKGKREAPGREITIVEYRKLFAACGDEEIGKRNAALLAVAMMGLRRAEIAKLTLDSFDDVNGILKALGKGNKERTIPLAAGAHRAITAWVTVRGQAPGPLLTRFTRAGLFTSKPINKQTVYDVIKAITKKAGVAKLTPHDFRRTMVSSILDQGDIGAAQSMAGHSNVATTLRYDRRGERSKRAAADKLNVPFDEPAVGQEEE